MTNFLIKKCLVISCSIVIKERTNREEIRLADIEKLTNVKRPTDVKVFVVVDALADVENPVDIKTLVDAEREIDVKEKALANAERQALTNLERRGWWIKRGKSW